MTLLELEPENDLEYAILDAKAGIWPIADTMNLMSRSALYISSKKEVLQDGSGFDPLLLEENGNPLVAAFSSLSRPGIHKNMAEYVLKMSGREFFLRLPPSYGVILNPGYVSQLIFSPTGVADFKRALSAQT